MIARRDFLGVCFAPLGAGPAAGGWKAGAAAVDITPEGPLWMAGFAARKEPSNGVYQRLYAKALALEDGRGQRAVLVASDMLGFPGALAGRIAARIEKEHSLGRERLLFNASHTHGGPVVDGVLPVAYPMSEAQWADVRRYTRQLEEKIGILISCALEALRPASLHFAETTAPFAVNFRVRTARGWIHAPNPEGAVDRSVPVLRVDGADGKPYAVVFGYACHPTVVPAIYQFHGDFAGFAQEAIERRYPGATALFLQGCGGDAKVSPRGTLDLARAYGELLGAIVVHAMEGKMSPVRGPLKCAFDTVKLPFAHTPSREELAARLKDANVFQQRLARHLLAQLDAGGRIEDSLPYPVETWSLAPDLKLIALGGETLVDYALRLKRELTGAKLFIVGYSNDVSCYIPSERVLAEGGYEGGDAMVYYGRPSPFAPGLEDKIIARVREQVEKVKS